MLEADPRVLSLLRRTIPTPGPTSFSTIESTITPLVLQLSPDFTEDFIPELGFEGGKSGGILSLTKVSGRQQTRHSGTEGRDPLGVIRILTRLSLHRLSLSASAVVNHIIEHVLMVKERILPLVHVVHDQDLFDLVFCKLVHLFEAP